MRSDGGVSENTVPKITFVCYVVIVKHDGDVRLIVSQVNMTGLGQQGKTTVFK